MRSYKLRGAYNLISQLDAATARPVWSAPAPATTRRASRSRARTRRARPRPPPARPHGRSGSGSALGGERVDLVVGGDTYDEASAAAVMTPRNRGDARPRVRRPRTIAGQGTVVREVVAAARPGPGVSSSSRSVAAGLLAGASAAWRAAPAACGSSGSSRRGGEHAGGAGRRWPVVLPELDPFVDGAAVRRVGRRDLPAGPRLRRRARERRRGPGVHRDARALPDRRDHRRARGGAGHAALGVVGSGPGQTVVAIALRRQQRRDPLRRGDGALAGPRGPASTTSWSTSRRSRVRCAASSTRCWARRRHRPLRVRQAQQPRDRSRPGGHRAGRPGIVRPTCCPRWIRARSPSRWSPPTARSTASWSDRRSRA